MWAGGFRPSSRLDAPPTASPPSCASPSDRVQGRRLNLAASLASASQAQGCCSRNFSQPSQRFVRPRLLVLVSEAVEMCLRLVAVGQRWPRSLDPQPSVHALV